MTEIRPIKMAEAESFLELLCETFRLDFNRAHGVFFDEPFFDLDRKWAMFQGTEIVSILTLTPLQFGWGEGVGIAGVATRERYRQEGLAGRLLDRVLAKIDLPALLFAQKPELYEKVGFEQIDRVIRAPLADSITQPWLNMPDEGRIMETDNVRRIYNRWAEAHKDRLRRNDQRWRYWMWNYRVAEPAGDGYVVVEPSLMREGLYHRSTEQLPFAHGAEWVGTTFMADQLGLSFEKATIELLMMGRNWPGIPQMFMTDQF